MEKIKIAVVEEIKKCKDSVAHVDTERLCNEVFSCPSSLRLTYSGYLLTKYAFKEYSFDIRGVSLVPKHLISLGKTMQFPYYITVSKLVVFSEADAVVIKLCGSVHKFLENAIITS